MKKIKIITDSGCDLDKDVLDELDVYMIPLKVNFGEETYKDRVTLSTREFYDKLDSFEGIPKTSQIPPAEFIDEFKEFLKDGYHIIYIAFSSGLSGTYQAACLAKDMMETEDIDVVDSKGASVGFGLMVREAALMVKQGKTNEEIVKRVEYMRDRMEHIFLVGNLEMLKKGGRISKTQALMGTLLNVKPVLQFEDGFIVPYEKVRGEKAAFKRMIETMKMRGHNIQNQVIGLNYSRDIDLCMKLKERIEQEFGVKEFVISEIGAAIGSHVGAGTTSVFFMRK
ncbi:MAG: DegV family protein [Clostridia bacterium]|nr:DegV family protein [Clostridia bacterium]